MASVKISKCPSCLAQLPARMDDGIVICTYCCKEAIVKHTMFLKRPKVQAPVNDGDVGPRPLPVNGRGRNNALAIAAWAAIPLVLSGVVAGVMAFTKASSSSSGGAQSLSAPAKVAVPHFARNFWIYDTDGDGTEDLVSSYRVYDSQTSESMERVGAFSGRDQRRLWMTEPFEESPKIHLHGDRLFAADSNLGLAMLDVKTGATIYKFTTDDKVKEFCDAPSGKTTWVSLSDETGFLVNHIDGQVTEQNERPKYCGPRQFHGCPSKPIGKSCEEWSPKTSSIQSPFVFVESRKKCLTLNPKSSSAWMHAGKCRRKNIDGMRGRVVLGKEKNFIVLGKKSPGTGFPMIAGLEDQTLLWARLIDRGPVENREKPTWATDSRYLGEFGDGQFSLAYKDKLGFKLIAIDIKTGEDRFLQPIAGSENFRIMRFYRTESRIYVHFAGGGVRIFDAITGKQMGQLGP